MDSPPTKRHSKTVSAEICRKCLSDVHQLLFVVGKFSSGGYELRLDKFTDVRFPFYNGHSWEKLKKPILSL